MSRVVLKGGAPRVRSKCGDQQHRTARRDEMVDRTAPQALGAPAGEALKQAQTQPPELLALGSVCPSRGAMRIAAPSAPARAIPFWAGHGIRASSGGALTASEDRGI